MRKKKVITKVMAMLLLFAVVFSMMPIGGVFADTDAEKRTAHKISFFIFFKSWIYNYKLCIFPNLVCNSCNIGSNSFTIRSTFVNSPCLAAIALATSEETFI